MWQYQCRVKLGKFQLHFLKVCVFKNLIVYDIKPGWSGTAVRVESALQAGRFVACAPTQEKSVGWVEPRGVEHGALLEVVDGQWILKLMIETKTVPASVVKRKAQERIDHIEATTGRKPGKKETRDMRDDTRLALLPQAFGKQMTVLIWIDPQAQRLLIDAASQARADEAANLLVQAVPDLLLQLIQTNVAPVTAMADWLLSQAAPAGFSVDMECELKATDTSKAVVRYSRHRLDTEEVQDHVRNGKLPTRLALTWQGRVSLVLTEGLQLKKLAFLEGVFERRGSDVNDDNFDADVAIATGELRKLLPDLLQALGGDPVANDIE